MVNAPSIGFGIVVDQLLAALSRQKIELTEDENTVLLVFSDKNSADAIHKSMELRKNGIHVETIRKSEEKSKDDYLTYAKKNNIKTVEFMDGV